VHVDKCLVHRRVTTESFMKIRDIVSLPYRSYSPNLAPSDFDLFCNVKERLEHAGITNENQLFEEVHAILRLTPGEELERALDAW
jgi:hypothetical protein